MKKKIFILEDDLDLGEIYVEALSEDYEIRWAKNIAEAKKIIKDFPADLLLLDYYLAGSLETGCDIAPLLKEARPDSQIVIFSNSACIEKEIEESGANNWWVKCELSLSELRKRIAMIIESGN